MRTKLTIYLLFFVLLLSYQHSYGQNLRKELPKFGFRYAYFYDYRVVHNTVNLNVILGNHDLYIGPELIHILILPEKYDDIDNYCGKTIGLNIGYRYSSQELISKLKLFGQLNFSIFQLKIYENQMGPPYSQENKSIVVENTVSIGADYNIFKRVHLFSGLGIGSYDGFFLMITSFTPTLYFGVDYNW